MQPPWCLRVYRPALPCLGLRDLCKADCRSHPPCREAAQHLWGPPQLLGEAKSQEQLLRCGSAAVIASRDAEPSPSQHNYLLRLIHAVAYIKSSVQAAPVAQWSRICLPMQETQV
ncbi:unnamed protein product [Rangifer tarandus platyrhynchus]|uniref:Uncharacterized protein n=1 Tax=Rangifer tarandus platyrhynchus TaxID=3082113 RepID=A0ACB1KES0_RANTA